MRSLLLSIFLMASINLAAQPELPLFRQIGAQDGLPEGAVYSILCDRDGIIWIGSYEGLFRYNGYKLIPFYSEGTVDTTTISAQRVLSLFEDDRNQIWVGTTNGVNVMNRTTGRFKRYLNKKGSPNQLPANRVHSILKDINGNVWISTKNGMAIFEHNRFRNVPAPDSFNFSAYTSFNVNNETWFAGNGPVFRYNSKLKKLERVKLDVDESAGKPGIALCSAKDKDGNFYMGTSQGVFILNPKTKTLKPSGFPESGIKNVRISEILNLDGTLWMASSIGLIKWKPGKSDYQVYGQQLYSPSGLTNSNIVSLCADGNHNLWLGTATSVASLQLNYNPVRFYTPFPELPLNDPGNHLKRVFEDHAGNIWTWNATGIFRSAGLGKPMVQIKAPQHSYYLDHFLELEFKGKRELLMSYSAPAKGVFRFNPASQAVERFPLDAKLDKLSCFRVEWDKLNKQNLFIGTWEGVCIFNLYTRDTTWIKPGGKTIAVRTLHQLSNGKWVFITSEGYSIYDNISGREELHLFDPDVKNMYNSGQIRDMAEGTNGSLWIATETGLSHYNARTGRYKNFNSSNGLKGGNMIYAMHADQKGNCWFVTNNYLIYLDITTEKFQYFSKSDGVLTTFNRRSYCTMKNGTVLFGGIGGVIAFNPDKMPVNPNRPHIVLTDFLVNNHSQHYDLLPENLNNLEISYRENAVTFEFAALEYNAPEKNEYAYRMVGFDTGWVYSGNERRATYTNLSPGNYTFEVKCTNSAGIWNETEILRTHLTVLPLYYQTWWFRSLVGIALILLLVLFLRFRKKQEELEHEKALAEQNARYKSKFLTNMSHEIRTPMNAIIGLNRLLLDTPLNPKQKEYTQAIQQSSENLLWIVNDILDQAKIESGKYTIANKPFQLDVILKQIHNLLSLKASEKGLEFRVEISNNVPLKLVGDPVRLYQILTNLVANAIKFTPKGKVMLFAECQSTMGTEAIVKFYVRDTGIGIPKEKINQIFESFNQLEEDSTHTGTGLGLTIARELISQMAGSIDVTSEVGKGAEFIVTIPFIIDTSSGVAVESQSVKKRSQKPLRVLLVDDTRFNVMLAQELISDFFPKANTDTAENGKVALEMIENNSYDIVLMDVKMPVMDGIEATRRIRASENEAVKTLPVLGLTANAIPEQLEQCFEAGMNDYLTKPVNADELFEKMNSLT